MKSRLGFTLIELVIFIIISGIVAAVAVPKFIELATIAKTAETTSVAAALSAANGVNYASRKANSSSGNTVTNCTDVATSLQGGLPTGFIITAATVTADATASCILIGPSSTTAIFSATGIT